jgi:lipid-binding SYLF domain-containing protein
MRFPRHLTGDLPMIRSLPLLALALAVVSGCAAPEGRTAVEKKAYAISVRDEALAELYAREPGARAQLEAAPGYVFLSGFAAHPGILTFANAYGIVQNNKTGKQTHVRLTRFGIGPGLAIKGYYLVVILKSDEVVAEVEQGGWNGGGLAEASFRFGDFGGSSAAEGLGGSKAAESYLWTHSGFALELAGVVGKLYPEDDLK